MFASSLSSAARQPKGRGYSRKQRRIESGGRGGYRPRPSCVNRTPASQKFRFPETQLSSPLIPPPKARECLQSPVASIRRRLPPTDHVRFTSRAGKCIGMLAFFSSPPSFPSLSPSPRARFRSRKLLAAAKHAVPIAFPTPAPEETLAMLGARRNWSTLWNERGPGNVYPTTVVPPFPLRPYRNGSGKISGRYLEPGECRLNTDMDAYRCIRWANESRVNNEAVVWNV